MIQVVHMQAGSMIVALEGIVARLSQQHFGWVLGTDRGTCARMHEGSLAHQNSHAGTYHVAMGYSVLTRYPRYCHVYPTRGRSRIFQ